jgi:hypothetical protein
MEFKEKKRDQTYNFEVFINLIFIVIYSLHF